MSGAIPFFSDMPMKAIPAVQRLYDEAQAPGYSLPVVYSNLVSRLNTAGVAPPARKYVSQWLAAVKIGMAARPELPAGITGPDPALEPTPGYFESLPDAAMPALAAAWDAIQAPTETGDEDDTDEKAFEVFFDAMLALGHMEPSWRGFVAYAKAVRLGHIKRPPLAGHVVEDAPAAEPPAPEDTSLQGAVEQKRRGRRPKADVLVLDTSTGAVTRPEVDIVLDPETREAMDTDTFRAAFLGGEAGGEPQVGEPAYVPLTPTSFREIVQGGVIVPEASHISFLPIGDASPVSAEVATRLRSLRSQLVADTCAILEVDIRRRAEKIVIDQLRAMADEMELGKAS